MHFKNELDGCIVLT